MNESQVAEEEEGERYLQVVHALAQSVDVRGLVLSVDGSVEHAFEAVDSHPRPQLAVERHYASAGER